MEWDIVHLQIHGEMIFKIDVNERICIHRKYKQLNNRILPVITLDICFTDGSKQAITLGANIIKESMAALYQMLIDETATHERYDLPYNLVKIIAEQHFFSNSVR